MSHSLFTTTKLLHTRRIKIINKLCDNDSLVQVSNITFPELQAAIVGSNDYTKSGDVYTQAHCPTNLHENLVTNGDNLIDNGADEELIVNLQELFFVAMERNTYIYIY